MTNPSFSVLANKKRWVVLFSLALSFTLCMVQPAQARKKTTLATETFQAPISTRFMQIADSSAMNAWVDSVMQSLSADERLGQLIIPIMGGDDNLSRRNLVHEDIKNYHIGGLLFSASTINAQAQLTNHGQKHAKVPMWVALDGEWGLNMRLKDAPRFPRNMALGCINASDKTSLGTSIRDSLLYAYGQEVARECRLMNIQINYAPDLDINSNPNNPVIGTRSFGDNISTVQEAASAYARGLEAGGVIAVGKHFPGHGDTDKDSHKTLPLLSHNRHRMDSLEMQPFRYFIEQGFAGIMVGHLSVPSLDDALLTPSSISAPIITDILHKQLRFTGLTFTDGLAMEGARRVPNLGAKALLAGIDVLLDPVPLNKQWKDLKAAVADGTLSQDIIDRKCRKVLQYKYLTGIKELQPIELEGLKERINSPQARQLARELYNASTCVLKNNCSSDDQPLLPLQQLQSRKVMVVSCGTSAVNTFTQTLRSYLPAKRYAFSAADASQKNSILKQAAQSNLVIIAIHSSKSADATAISQLCQQLNCPYMFVFFTSPYKMLDYKKPIEQAQAVVLAHETYELAQTAAAEAIMGGINVNGQLSVNLPDLFPFGTGCCYPKIRLGEAEPEKVGMHSLLFEEIDSLANDGLKKEAYPGCQILIARNGYIVYNKAFGYTDYDKTQKVTTETIYDLASVSKAAATVPAMMMVQEQCNLHLGDKLSSYIPALDTVADKKKLTIREALFHETGMRDSYPFYKMAIDPNSATQLYSSRHSATFSIRQDKNLYFNKNYRYLPQLISAKADATHTLQVAHDMYLNPIFADSIMQKMIDLPLKNRGSYRYSCLNFILLRMVIENCTGQSLDAYLHDRLFAPIGASSLCYNPMQTLSPDDTDLIAPTENDAAIRKQLLKGYVHDEIAAFHGGVEGNAGLFGSAQDLVKVLQMMLNQGEYGGQRYVNNEICKLYTSTKSPKSRRGLGFDKPNIAEPSKSPTAKECPASVYGHTGYTGTCFWVDPDHQLVYIFLCNRVNPHRWNNTLTRHGYRTEIQHCIYKSMEP